jgi:hypothetical protein
VSVQDVRGWLEAGTALLVAGVLLGLATAAGPYFVSSAGTAMLETELTGLGDDLTMLGVHSSGTLAATDLVDADRLLSDHVQQHGLPEPARQLVIEVATADGRGRVNLIGRDGDATDQLPPVREPGEGPVAITAASAARLGLGAGQDLVVAAPARGGQVTIPVGVVVEDFVREAMPPAWRPVTGLLAPPDDPRLPPPPPALVMDHDQALALLDQLGHELTDGVATGQLVQAAWTVGLDAVPTLEAAQALVPRLEAVRVHIADPTSEVGAALTLPGWTPPIVGGASLDAAVGRVARAVGQLAVPVQLLAVAGQLLALAGTAAAVTLGGRRQLSRAQLWHVRGVPATTLALRWAIPVAAPLTLGVLLGGVAADVLTRQLGPGGPADATVRNGMWSQLALAAAAALAVAVVTAAVAIRLRARGTAAPRRVPPIAEVLAVTVAGLALWQAHGQSGTVTPDADGLLGLDLLTVALPILLVVAAAAVGTRLLGLLLHLLGRTSARRPTWFLASRRLRAFGGTERALAFVTAAAVGVFVFATTVAVSSEATVAEKAGLMMGADAVLALSRSTVDHGIDAGAIPTATTRVRRMPDAVLDDGTVVDLLAIDPDTFAGVAYSPRYLGDIDVDELTSRLAGVPAHARDATLPAIAVGAPPGSATAVRIADLEVAIDPVGTAPIFPGAAGSNPSLVVPDAGPLAPGDPAVTARLAYAVSPELWVSGEGGDLTAERQQLEALARAAVPPATAGSRPPAGFAYAADLRDDPGVAPMTWTYRFLRAQSAVAAVIGWLALLGHHVVSQRRQALGTGLATRMGLRRSARAVAEAIELAALAGIALAVGTASGIIAARSVMASYDPVPDVALPAVFRVPLEGLSGPFALACLAVGLAVLVTMRVVDRVPVARLLRSGT